MKTMQKQRILLGELLVEHGLISPEELEQALAEQKRTGELLGAILARMGKLSQEQLLQVLAQQVGMPYVRLANARIAPEALEKVPPKFASHYRLMPLAI